MSSLSDDNYNAGNLELDEESPFKRPRFPAIPNFRTRRRGILSEENEFGYDVGSEGNHDSSKKRLKDRQHFLDLSAAPDDEEEDDDQFGEFSEMSFSNFEMSSQAQNLSQICFQVGQFTYHPDFINTDNESGFYTVGLDDFSLKPPKHFFSNPLPAPRDKPFFHAVRENLVQGQYQMLASNLNISYQHFIQPTASNISFLRMFLRVYPKLTVERFGGGTLGRTEFKKMRYNYLKFWRHFFFNIALVHWKRAEIMELFHSPQEEPLPHDFFFTLIGYVLRLCVKYRQFKLNLSLTPIHRNLLLAYEYFQLVFQFLRDDFDQLLTYSSNYSSDICSLMTDSKPIILRMMWQNKKPDYISSVFKYFLTFLVKSFKLGIQEVSSPLMEMFMRISETIRICAGNVRPYLVINSSRVAVASELYASVQKEVFKDGNEEWTGLRWFVDLTTRFPWISLQMCIAILQRFVNLNQHFHKSKYKLSLRMLLHTYLAGDVNTFKYEEAERLTRNREVKTEEELMEDNLTRLSFFQLDSIEKTVQTEMVHQTRSKKLPSSGSGKDCDYLNPNINVSNLEVLYRKFSTNGEKTSFGGNSMHIACRRGDVKWISSLWELVDPNMPDSQGNTPLNDAARLGHTNCVVALIEASKETGLQLDFETASKTDGTTPLHNAILQQDETSIRLILEFGGRHLLMNRMNSGKTAEDLLPESLKTLPDTIEYKNSLIVLPPLSNLTEAELYSRSVANLIDSYLNTTRLMNFAHIIRKYKTDLEYINETATDEDIAQHLHQHFHNIWGRAAAEDDIEHLMDDLEMLPKIRAFIEKFTRNSLAPFSPSLPNCFEKLHLRVDQLLEVLNTPIPTSEEPFLKETG